jgi:hypothetical protein
VVCAPHRRHCELVPKGAASLLPITHDNLRTVTEDETPFDAEPGEESEDDLPQGDPHAFEQTAVYSSDWTAETILNQLRRGNIQLDPSFQRREAWRDERKSAFVESLFLGLPIPQIVLAERRDRRGAFIVIDGKQRLLALRRFAPEPEDTREPLRLRGLEVRADLNGKTLAEIEVEPGLSDDLAFFQNQTIRTVVVRGWPDDDFLFRVFLRLNQTSVKLSPQELRQALLPGAFVTFADTRSGESEPIQRALGLKEPDFRMRDVEILVRYYAFSRFLTEYRGNLKAFLDLTCRELNAQWDTERAGIEREADICDSAIAATERVFGDDAFRRWNGQRYEGRFNRAVFDVMVYYFRDPVVAEAAIGVGDQVQDAYRQLSVDDPAFVDAVQSTTKTLDATQLRLERWGRALMRSLGIDLPIPVLEGRRIHLPPA